MNLKLLSGYALAVVCVLILAAACFLLINNAGDHWDLHVFWKTRTMSRSLWLLVAGVGGLVLWMTFRKLLPAAISSLRAGAKQRREKLARQELKHLTDQQKKQGS